MNLRNGFWDASALHPLCVREAVSSACKALTSQFGLVVWWATPLEIQSAIERVHRSGSLSTLERQEAIDRLTLLQNRWMEVPASDAVRDSARSLLHSHSLRAADSLQLAAALVWCQRRTAGRTFISGDLRLCQAATLEGFTVIQVKP